MDRDVEIAAALKATRDEMEQSRTVIQDLANSLADVIDVVEPALAAHTKKIRQARMAAVDEMRQVTAQIKEMREVILSDSTRRMIVEAERLLALFGQLQALRDTGFFDDFVRLMKKDPPS